MSDMLGWRAWADSAHRETLRTPKKRILYRCTNCSNRSTVNQAKIYKGKCMYCKHVLRAFREKQ